MNVIYFDSDCMLCNNFIRAVHRIDKDDLYLFASLQDERELQSLAKYGYSSLVISQIILQKNGKLYFKSDAVIEIFKSFYAFRYLSLLCSAVPKKLRDKIYDVVAKNRYLFGQARVCSMDSKLRIKILNSRKQEDKKH